MKPLSPARILVWLISLSLALIPQSAFALQILTKGTTLDANPLVINAKKIKVKKYVNLKENGKNDLSKWALCDLGVENVPLVYIKEPDRVNLIANNKDKSQISLARQSFETIWFQEIGENILNPASGYFRSYELEIEAELMKDTAASLQSDDGWKPPESGGWTSPVSGGYTSPKTEKESQPPLETPKPTTDFKKEEKVTPSENKEDAIKKLIVLPPGQNGIRLRSAGNKVVTDGELIIYSKSGTPESSWLPVKSSKGDFLSVAQKSRVSPSCLNGKSEGVPNANHDLVFNLKCLNPQNPKLEFKEGAPYGMKEGDFGNRNGFYWYDATLVDSRSCAEIAKAKAKEEEAKKTIPSSGIYNQIISGTPELISDQPTKFEETSAIKVQPQPVIETQTIPSTTTAIVAPPAATAHKEEKEIKKTSEEEKVNIEKKEKLLAQLPKTLRMMVNSFNKVSKNQRFKILTKREKPVKTITINGKNYHYRERGNHHIYFEKNNLVPNDSYVISYSANFVGQEKAKGKALEMDDLMIISYDVYALTDPKIEEEGAPSADTGSGASGPPAIVIGGPKITPIVSPPSVIPPLFEKPKTESEIKPTPETDKIVLEDPVRDYENYVYSLAREFHSLNSEVSNALKYTRHGPDELDRISQELTAKANVLREKMEKDSSKAKKLYEKAKIAAEKNPGKESELAVSLRIYKELSDPYKGIPGTISTIPAAAEAIKREWAMLSAGKKLNENVAEFEKYIDEISALALNASDLLENAGKASSFAETEKYYSELLKIKNKVVNSIKPKADNIYGEIKLGLKIETVGYNRIQNIKLLAAKYESYLNEELPKVVREALTLYDLSKKKDLEQKKDGEKKNAAALAAKNAAKEAVRKERERADAERLAKENLEKAKKTAEDALKKVNLNVASGSREILEANRLAASASSLTLAPGSSLEESKRVLEEAKHIAEQAKQIEKANVSQVHLITQPATGLHKENIPETIKIWSTEDLKSEVTIPAAIFNLKSSEKINDKTFYKVSSKDNKNLLIEENDSLPNKKFEVTYELKNPKPETVAKTTKDLIYGRELQEETRYYVYDAYLKSKTSKQ